MASVKEFILTIKDHPFEDVISVVFSDNPNESVRAQLEPKGVDHTKYQMDDYADAAVISVDEPQMKATWCVFNIGRATTGIISHECVHLTFGLLNYRGIKHDESTDEVYAYVQQWLLEKIERFWREEVRGECQQQNP